MADPIVPVAPSLPLATQTYDPRNIEQITRVLRLYFRQLDAFDQTILQKILALETSVYEISYGSFYDTTDQFAAVANTAYGMTFNTTDTVATSGFSIGSPTSRIYTDRTDVYNIQFSAQLLSNSGGTHTVWIWFRKNGTDIADSTTKVTVEGNNTAVVAAWNYVLQLNATDYFEIMWASNDTHVYLHEEAATGLHPRIPSVILTVTKFNN